MGSACTSRPMAFGLYQSPFQQLTPLRQGGWVISTAPSGALGDLTRSEAPRITQRWRGWSSRRHIFLMRGLYALASRSLRRLVAFEGAVLLFIIFASVVQLFRVAAHMAECAGSLFFSLYTRAWHMKGSSSQQCRETERTVELPISFGLYPRPGTRRSQPRVCK